MKCAECDGQGVAQTGPDITDEIFCDACNGSGKAKLTSPPLGVMPVAIWEDQRMADLARAIKEYIDAGLGIEKADLVGGWCSELDCMLRNASHNR
jgi:hypothetical protein